MATFDGSDVQRKHEGLSCRKVPYPAPDTLRQLVQKQLLDMTIPDSSISKATSPQRQDPLITARRSQCSRRRLVS